MFLPPPGGTPTVFPLDGYVPTWSPDSESNREGISCLLNRLAQDVIQPLKPYQYPGDPAPSTAAYLRATTCAQAIHSAIIGTPAGSVVYDVDVTIQDQSQETSGTKKFTSGGSMYHFSSYGMYEYPFSWLVKCSMMLDRDPDNSQVNCPEWTFRISISETQNNAANVWDFLSRVDGGFTYTDEAADRTRLSARYTHTHTHTVARGTHRDAVVR